MTPSNLPQPGALDALYETIYGELRGIAQTFVARNLTGKHQRTSLVSASYLKLRANGHPAVTGTEHLKRLMAKAMRFACIDWHREQQTLKRGGRRKDLPLRDTNLGESGESRDTVSDYVDLYDALPSFELLYPDLAPLIEGWLLWECSPKELAEMYNVSLAQAQAALRLFKRHLDGPP